MVVEAVSGGPDSQTRASWLDLIGLLLVAILLLWGIGSYGLYEPHEAQYGGGASEMVQRGDWSPPTSTATANSISPRCFTGSSPPVSSRSLTLH